MEEISQKKSNWKVIIGVIFLTLIQLGLVFIGYIMVFINGIDTYIPEVATRGIILITIATLIPLPFWGTAIKKHRGRIFALNLLISILLSIFLICYWYYEITANIQHNQQVAQALVNHNIGYNNLISQLKVDFSGSQKIVGFTTEFDGITLTLQSGRKILPVDAFPVFSQSSYLLSNQRVSEFENQLLGQKVQVKVDNNTQDYPGSDITDIYINHNHYVPAHVYINGKLLDKSFVSKQ